MIMGPDTDTTGYAAAALLDLLPADAAVGAPRIGAPVPAVRGGIVSRSALFELLGRAGRVTQVSAPAGSGKTFLLQSWIGAAGLAESTAWVSVQGEERNSQPFWVSVLSALRQTAAGATVVRPLTAAPDLDGWAVVERLLQDLESLQDQVWLVIDDVHELRSAGVLRQLELLLMRAPPKLRCVLVTRHDVRLGLHRLRLEGEVTEIRAANLRFTLDEARALLGGAGVELPGSALTLLHARTEGWAAGLRLAALSLAGHPDPERLAAEFSGSERTVAEYLLTEVLERQSEEVRRLLLRTSLLERVSGELADLLTGGSGGERILQDLEETGAFVVALDGRRSWFRYHQLFADLLQLELRRSPSGEIAALHHTAARWYADHEYPLEAVRHAQAAQDWGLASPGRCALLWRRCGSSKTTRRRRPPRSRPSWTAPLPQISGPGCLRLSCWRPSPGTRSATPPPPAARSSARSIWPSLTVCCRRSCSTPLQGCSSAMPGTAPSTQPWSLRSSACFQRPGGAGSPAMSRRGLGRIVPPG
jgi:LuxR family maltose regulon positive regulatory protein